MGRKYASIHIRTDKPEEVIERLKGRYVTDHDNMKNLMNMACKFINGEQARYLLERTHDLWTSEVLVIRYASFVSVYDDRLSFETVEKKARELLKDIDEPVAYTSVFDDDIFFFGVYRRGKIITGGRVGENLRVYGISRKPLTSINSASDKCFKALLLEVPMGQIILRLWKTKSKFAAGTPEFIADEVRSIRICKDRDDMEFSVYGINHNRMQRYLSRPYSSILVINICLSKSNQDNGYTIQRQFRVWP